MGIKSISQPDNLPEFREAYPISDQVQADYARDGFVRLRGIFSRDEIARIRSAVHASASAKMASLKPLSERDDYGKMFIQIGQLWSHDPAIRNFCLCERVGQIAADVMGVDAVRLFLDQILFKEPGGPGTPWHQDQFYIPVDVKDVVSIWIPLVDVSEEMGTMGFAAGSHLEGQLPDPTISNQSNEFYQDLIAQKKWKISPNVAMAAGDATLHSGWTLHQAPGNSTDQVREVVVLVYYADGANIIQTDNAQQLMLAHWNLGGRLPGEAANSCANPVVYRRP